MTYSAETLQAAADLCEAIDGLRGTEQIRIRRTSDTFELEVQCPPRLQGARRAIHALVKADGAAARAVR